MNVPSLRTMWPNEAKIKLKYYEKLEQDFKYEMNDNKMRIPECK